MAASRHELRDRRPDKPGPLHQVRPLPHRLRGHLAPGRCRHQGQRHEALRGDRRRMRSEEHTSELQSLMRISYAVFCLKKKKKTTRKKRKNKDIITKKISQQKDTNQNDK